MIEKKKHNLKIIIQRNVKSVQSITFGVKASGKENNQEAAQKMKKNQKVTFLAGYRKQNALAQNEEDGKNIRVWQEEKVVSEDPKEIRK